MKLLGLISIVLGLIKLGMTWSLNSEEVNNYFLLTKDGKEVYKYLLGILVVDGLVELICGLFIMIVW